MKLRATSRLSTLRYGLIPIFLDDNMDENVEHILEYINELITINDNQSISISHTITKKLLETLGKDVNTSFSHVTGYTFDELIKKPFPNKKQIHKQQHIYHPTILISCTQSMLEAINSKIDKEKVTNFYKYKLGTYSLSYGFIKKRSTKKSKTLHQLGTVIIDPLIQDNVEEAFGQHASSIRRRVSHIRQKGTHDGWHNLVYYNDQKDRKNIGSQDILNNGTNIMNAETSSIRISNDILNTHAPDIHQKTIEEFLYFFSRIHTSTLDTDAKEYLLLLYAYPFFRRINPELPECKTLREKLSIYNIYTNNDNDLFRNAFNEQEISIHNIVHQGIHPYYTRNKHNQLIGRTYEELFNTFEQKLRSTSNKSIVKQLRNSLQRKKQA